MKKLIIFLGLLLSLSLIVNTVSVAYAADPGINQGSGSGDNNGEGGIGIVPGINSSSVSKITKNGSYILPNGIIILVDEDIKDYENGTIIFYEKNESNTYL